MDAEDNQLTGNFFDSSDEEEDLNGSGKDLHRRNKSFNDMKFVSKQRLKLIKEEVKIRKQSMNLNDEDGTSSAVQQAKMTQLMLKSEVI